MSARALEPEARRRRGPSSRGAGPAASATTVCLVACLAGGLVSCERSPTEEPIETVEVTAPETATERRLRLYFPGPAGLLVAEERELPPTPDRRERIRAVAGSVLAGPTAGELMAPFGGDVELGSVHVSADDVVFLDLLSSEPSPPPSGSRDEMLSVFSLVNSVLLAVPDLEGVVLLWNGQQRPTFAGHLDTARPLSAKLDLVAR